MSTDRKRSVSIHCWSSASDMIVPSRRLNRRHASGDGRVNDVLRFREDVAQMFFALETFRINLVDRLGAGWPRREPAARGDRLDAADCRVVAGRAIKYLFDFFAGQLIAVQ